MTLKERLQAEYQNEIEKMAQAEELLNFQVRCLMFSSSMASRRLFFSHRSHLASAPADP